MNDIKYLSDGRKVTVVGRLNNQDIIVQEIFVTKDGSEIPSGENFVVRSLHDEPVESWKIKEERELEQRINKLKSARDSAQAEYNTKYENLKAVSAILGSSKKLAELIPEQELPVLTAFMTGTIEYLVIDSWEITPPVRMIDNIIQWEDRWHGDEKRFDAIKLLSVLGDTKGNLEYRIHDYRDGSGSWKKVYPFTDKEDALNFIKEIAEGRINENKLWDKSYDNCKEMGIIFSDEHEKKYKDYTNQASQQNIDRVKKEIKERESLLNELEKSLIK